jgi:pantetheine-phosphate adenylyltransferase
MGHVSVAKRAAKFAEKLIVAVLDNSEKKPMFSAHERILFLQDALADVRNVEIEAFSGLLADYAKQKSANAILRGLRTAADFEREYQYAICNAALSCGIETIFIPASPEFVHISSTIIKEAAAHINNENKFLAEMLPPAARTALLNER